MVNEKESLKHKVLSMLRESSGIVSGVALSDATGRSRVAVWKTVQGLQEAGYGIEVGRKGYRLVNDLADSIYPWEFGAHEAMFTHFASTGSTMAEAKIPSCRYSLPQAKVTRTKNRNTGIEVPVASPSTPSVILTALTVPTITNTDSRASAEFTRSAAKGEAIVMKSAGAQLRSYCYCLDCAA